MIFYKYFTNKFKAEKRNDGLEYADFSSRYMSLLFDLVVMIMILKFLYSGSFLISKLVKTDQNSQVSSSVLYKHQFEMPLKPQEQKALDSMKKQYIYFQILSFFFIFTYLISTWYYFGGTIGNIVFGVRIFNENNNKLQKLSLKTCFIRLLALILTVFTIFIGFFSAFFNPKKMTLYDKLSGTVAIKNKSLKKFFESNDEIDKKKFIRFDIFDSILKPITKKIFSFLKKPSSAPPIN